MTTSSWLLSFQEWLMIKGLKFKDSNVASGAKIDYILTDLNFKL